MYIPLMDLIAGFYGRCGRLKTCPFHYLVLIALLPRCSLVISAFLVLFVLCSGQRGPCDHSARDVKFRNGWVGPRFQLRTSFERDGVAVGGILPQGCKSSGE